MPPSPLIMAAPHSCTPPPEECRQKAKQYGDYFLVEYRDQEPHCISPCESNFNASKNCNHGTCQMSQNGARCL